MKMIEYIILLSLEIILIRISVAFLNINSILIKLSLLFSTVGYKLEIFAFAETEIDETFTDSQFNMVGFRSPYRLDKTENGGGLLIYVIHGIFSDLNLKHCY